MNAPIEVDTVTRSFFPIAIPVIIGGRSTRRVAMYVGSVMVYHLSLESTTAVSNIAAGIPTYINNHEPLFGIILTTTHAYESSILSSMYPLLLVPIFCLNSQIIRRIYPAESKSDGFCRVRAHSLNSNSPVFRFIGQAPGKAVDLGISYNDTRL
jgi:hypothetical protein